MPSYDLGGASFAIMVDGNEVKAGFETIPLGSNNVGEFSGGLLGLKAAREFCTEVELIGDCKILDQCTG